MFNYHTFLFINQASLILLAATVALSLFVSSKTNMKIASILILGGLIIFSDIGMITRAGVQYGLSLPMWFVLKETSLLLAVFISIFCSKVLKNFTLIAYIVVMFLIILSVYLNIFKSL